jgi:hypothetical protein
MNRKSGTAIGLGMAALAAAAIAAAPAALAQDTTVDTAVNVAEAIQTNEIIAVFSDVDAFQANVADITQAAIAGSEHILVLP